MSEALEYARQRFAQAQDALMDAQLAWAHAHRDWVQAVNDHARARTVAPDNTPHPHTCECVVCKCSRASTLYKEGCEERETQPPPCGYKTPGMHVVKCESCGCHTHIPVNERSLCMACLVLRVEEAEKGRGNVGPHTDAGKVEGWACYFHWPVPDPWCERCKSATHHATHNTQVPESKGPDTTSHG